MELPYRPCMETLQVLTSCLNQDEDERVSIDELVEHPYFFNDSYLPHYLNESQRDGSSAERSTYRGSRANSSPLSRRGGNPQQTSFKMVLSSKDSTFSKRLSDSLQKLTKSGVVPTRGTTMTTTML